MLLLTGCSGGADSSDSSAAHGGTAPEAAAAQDGVPEQAVSTRVTVTGAALVRTAELTVRVDDVRAAADEAARLAVAVAGTVASEERSGTDGAATAVVRLRVPPERFDETVTRIARLGVELDRRIATTDVTDQVVDLESRLATQRASVARVRALLDEADALAEVVQVEGELTRRTADLESLQARLAAVRGQVEQSTVTASLVGDDAAAGTAPRGFRDGLGAGWAALQGVLRAVAVTAGALLPFTPVLLVVGALVWRSRRRTSGQASA